METSSFFLNFFENQLGDFGDAWFFPLKALKIMGDDELVRHILEIFKIKKTNGDTYFFLKFFENQ